VIRRRHPASPSFAGFRFPPDVVLLAVRRYIRYGLSYRDVEELLAERGIEVDHVTIYRWVQRFTLWVPDIRSWMLTRHDVVRSSGVVYRILYRFLATLARLACGCPIFGRGC
jgi:transposase-like protein